MRSNQVVKLTGLNKRNLYYYIEEQLISPAVNPDNGYYIFSEEDVRNLFLIKQLRNMDFSIKDIRDILNYPKSFNIFLQKQIEKLQKEQQLLEKQILQMSELNERLQLAPITRDFLAEKLEEVPIPAIVQSSTSQNETINEELILLHFWGSFLQDLTMTSYRKDLWNKVLTEVRESQDPSISLLKDFLFNLSAERLEEKFARHNLTIKRVADLTDETIDQYTENIKKLLVAALNDKEYLSYWKANYHNFLLPSTKLYDSEINNTIRELSPMFSVYYNNVHYCYGKLYDWLHSEEGAKYKEQLYTILDGYMDIEAHHNGLLAGFVSNYEYFHAW